ncbi:cupin domain-containing protein [Litorimonas sp. WD9-15]|uniref:cupin domain-containing protein n=1 Tax=Litorimonas sp. WD9-15 TaxID=3418716 RepID=UPI003CFCB076
MNLNDDFSQRVVIDTNTLAWEPSPMAGVERRKLDRIGDEVARATTIVRYAPESYFSPHTHSGGEEILVLSGVFSDEHGDYPAGSYFRNPIGTSHKPHSKEGCEIFVKLHQFDERDTEQFSIDTKKAQFMPGQVPGLSVFPLHSFEGESCALVRWAPGTHFAPHRHWGGEEILVLEGTFQDEMGDYPKGTWMRSPHLSQHNPFSEEGCLIYVKTGHLPD